MKVAEFAPLADALLKIGNSWRRVSVQLPDFWCDMPDGSFGQLQTCSGGLSDARQLESDHLLRMTAASIFGQTHWASDIWAEAARPCHRKLSECVYYQSSIAIAAACVLHSAAMMYGVLPPGST